MARIKLSALVSSLNGPLNGSAIHTSKGSTFLRNKAYPKKSNSKSRLAHLHSFSSLKGAWNGLSLLNKLGWAEIASKFPIFDKNGDPQILTGYAYFLRVNLKLLAFGNQPVQSPTSGLPIGVSSTLEVSELNVLQNSNGYSIDSIIFNFEATSFIPSNSIFFISIGSPQKGNNGRNWQKMHPLVSFSVQKNMVAGTSFQIAVPNPKLPISISQFPNQIYRFELAFLDLGSMKFTTISTTEAYSISQDQLPRIFTNSTVSTTDNSFQAVTSNIWTTLTFGNIWVSPYQDLSDFQMEIWVGFPVPASLGLFYSSNFYFGSSISTILKINDDGFGIQPPDRADIPISLSQIPINYNSYLGSLRLPVMARMKNTSSLLYTPPYFLSRDLRF